MKKEYISYFQETNSYGIVTKAQNKKEAAKKAAQELKDKVSKKIYVSKMPLTHVQTEEWTPDIEVESARQDEDNVRYVIHPNDDFVEVVSKHFNKPAEDLTDEDFETFFMDCTKEFIEKGNQWLKEKSEEKIAELENQ
jgi:hypothetical protein